MANGEWFPLDRYADPVPSRRPHPVRRTARKAAPVAAVLGGLVLLVGSVWQVADFAWSRGDSAPVVLPNTRPASTPAPYPFGRAQVVEQAPVPVKQRAALEAACRAVR